MSKPDLTTTWVFTRHSTRQLIEREIDMADVLDVLEDPLVKYRQQDDESDDVVVYQGEHLAVIVNDAEHVVITVHTVGGRA